MSAVPSTPKRSTPSLAQQFLLSQSLPSGTPVKSNISQNAYDSGQALSFHERRAIQAKAMNGYTVGDMDFKDFLKAFVPEAPTPAPKVEYLLGPLVDEKALYNPLVSWPSVSSEVV